jgi:hypothetical protein
VLRGDLSNRLVHLTRGTNVQEAARTFEAILRSGELRGGRGYIRGSYECVCFSEAPLSVLSQVLSLAPIENMRYAPFGVMIGKRWLFERGGRPVIYQAEDEFEALPEAIRYRHVRYEPHAGVDYTWEREWRFHGPRLALDPAQTTFIVPTRQWERRFQDEHIGAVAQDSAMLKMPYDVPMPWHFVALEDLGVEGLAVDDP